jgi:F-type H+-transporting ATPase subunit gamma
MAKCLDKLVATMSQSHELQLHIHQLEEIRSILNAMKNLALMAVHKLTQLQQLQSQVVEHIEDSSTVFLTAYPDFIGKSYRQTVYLVFGSERGFCGDFNEILLNSLENKPDTKIIAIGNRCVSRSESYTHTLIASLNGINVVEESLSLLEQLMLQINKLSNDNTLIAVYHDLNTNQVKHRQIIPHPLLPQQTKEEVPPPLLNLSAELFFSKMLEQYLLAVLYEIIYISSLSENRRRLQHLEGAVKHLDEQTQKLHRKSQIHRQEEITEELEVILLNTGFDDAIASNV